MTPAEKVLWSRLRDGQIEGAHFRRQLACGHWIIDFFCAQAGLAIEVDGEVHKFQALQDAERDRQMKEEKGWLVLRFPNCEVMENLDAVLESIAEVVMERREEDL